MRKVLLVTGASAGIGAQVARIAATENYTICINYRRNRQAALQLVAELEKLSRVIAVQADISNEKEVIGLFEQIDERLGPLTALVNNAGIVKQACRFEQIAPDRLQEIFAINVFGSFYCAREAIRRMSTRHGGSGGSIVNISSIAARLGSPSEYVDYAASKAAIDTFTVGLSKELAEEGIRVNAVRPGIIRTSIHAASGDINRPDRLSAGIPMKRPGEPDEVAEAVMWLLSEKSSYVTGALLDVAGGR